MHFIEKLSDYYIPKFGKKNFFWEMNNTTKNHKSIIN